MGRVKKQKGNTHAQAREMQDTAWKQWKKGTTDARPTKKVRTGTPAARKSGEDRRKRTR